MQHGGHMKYKSFLFYGTLMACYSDQTLTFANHLQKNQNVVHPTGSPWQRWLPHQTKNGKLSVVFLVGSG